MNVFFFKHPLTTDDWVGAPGRYPFDVTGPALVREGDLLRRTTWTGWIYADGKAECTPSTNMDPHVLSDALPSFLSFCRIDKTSALAKTDPAALTRSDPGSDRSFARRIGCGA